MGSLEQVVLRNHGLGHSEWEHHRTSDVYSDAGWSEDEFEGDPYELYADPSSCPPMRDTRPPFPPPLSPTMRRGPPKAPSPQIPQENETYELYMAPGDTLERQTHIDSCPPLPPRHPAPRTVNNQLTGIRVKPTDETETTMVSMDDELYMAPDDAQNRPAHITTGPPLPPRHPAQRTVDQLDGIRNQSSEPESESISGLFDFLDEMETTASECGGTSEVNFPRKGSRINRPLPEIPPDPSPSPPIQETGDLASKLQEALHMRKASITSNKPPLAPKPSISSSYLTNPPRESTRTPPKPPPKPAKNGWSSGNPPSAPWVMTESSPSLTDGGDDRDNVRARVLKGAKKLPPLPVGNLPTLKSTQLRKRNQPPTPPISSEKPSWAVQRQLTPKPLPSPPKTPSSPPPMNPFLPMTPMTLKPPLAHAPPPPVMPDPPPMTPPRLPPSSRHGRPPHRELHLLTPQSTITSMANLDNLGSYHWFHGILTRDIVNERLYSINGDGTYLVRYSNQGDVNNPYTLSILFNNKVWNLHIRLRPDHTFALGRYKEYEATFNSVPELVEYHSEEEIILSGQDGGETKLRETPSGVERNCHLWS